ncbi:MAG TPA: metallophosphoesterase [Candidatus Nanoarchaeia archaeon]|nr:metallophosphoesterase [Candidatus Nanoarchaeia archaeon]
MEKKTKILAAGDIHGDTGLAKKLAEKAKKENVDLVILAGDLTMFDTNTKNLVGPFVKLKKPVLLLHGNHESLATIDFLTELYSPNAKNLHGYSIIKNDVGIFGAGGADFGMSPMSESEFFKTLNKAHKGIRDLKKKIMVTHMHPFKSKAEFSGFKGSTGIRKAIKEFHPDILISGHIHEAEGIEEKIGNTKVINIGKKGKIIEI